MRYNDFSFLCDLARRHDQRFILLHWQEPIKVNYHPVKFSGHRHSGSRDIMFLVCHVIVQDDVIKGSCDYIGGNPS